MVKHKLKKLIDKYWYTYYEWEFDFNKIPNFEMSIKDFKSIK